MSLSDSRLGQNPVRLIGINAPFEPKLQFGREYQTPQEPRARVAEAWGVQNHGRQQAPQTGIKQPLPAREQTALSYQLSPQLRQQLRGGIKPFQNQGRAAYAQKPAELESVHLGASLAHRAPGNNYQHGVHLGAETQRAYRAESISTAPHSQGGMVLRRMRGDLAF